MVNIYNTRTYISDLTEMRYIIIQVVMAPKRKMRNEWLLKEEFTPWLTRVEGDPEKAFCTTCNKEFHAELSTIKRHKVTTDWVGGCYQDILLL